METGVSAAINPWILIFLYKTSHPHVAEVGLMPGTRHFRNVLRHEVDTTLWC